MREIVDSGEFDKLQPERLWSEIYKSHQEKEPSRFWRVLKELGADKKLPGFISDNPWPARIDSIAIDSHPQWHIHRLACLLQAVDKKSLSAWGTDSLSRERQGQWQYLLKFPPWHLASVDEKLAINKQLRAQQDPEKAAWIMHDVLISQGREIDAKNAFFKMVEEVSMLSKIDYAYLAMGKNNSEIINIIENSQRDSLTPKAYPNLNLKIK